MPKVDKPKLNILDVRIKLVYGHAGLPVPNHLRQEFDKKPNVAVNPIKDARFPTIPIRRRIK